FQSSIDLESVRVPRQVRLEEQYRNLRPDLEWNTSVEEFAAIAQLAFAPKEIPGVGLTHLHAPKVSIREQAGILMGKLRTKKRMSFRELIADSADRAEFVARFLGILELYRAGAIGISQENPFDDFIVILEDEGFGDEALSNLGVDYAD
ncbi:MAG: segregation/condensation protein A, partial [Aquiluna sp.]|nr:segregation/condensation protein A [Aquiluna sp.]